MKKLAVFGALVVLGVAGSAQAKPPRPPKAPAPPKAPVTCTARNAGFKATGTLVSIPSTTIEVNVKKANHHAPTGDQTYPLGSARVKYHHGVSSTSPAPGSRVKLSGTITQMPHKSCQTGFTPTITLKKVDISKAAKK